MPASIPIGGSKFNERTAIGLDVHARSVRAAALDTATGEIVVAKLPPGNAAVIEWIGQRQRLGPLAAAHEVGPTGFGLARRWRLRGSGAWSLRRRRSSGPPGSG